MTGYLYRGDPWLEKANARILAIRERNPGATLTPRLPGDTTCPNGHPRGPGATVTGSDGKRRCRACRTAASARKRRKETP